MRDRSTEIPPCSACSWPSSEVPVPKAMTGTPWAAHIRTICDTSSVVCGNTTASGGMLGIQVSVWPCCWRTARLVTSRLPKAAASARVTAAMASGDGGRVAAWRATTSGA